MVIKLLLVLFSSYPQDVGTALLYTQDKETPSLPTETQFIIPDGLRNEKLDGESESSQTTVPKYIMVPFLPSVFLLRSPHVAASATKNTHGSNHNLELTGPEAVSTVEYQADPHHLGGSRLCEPQPCSVTESALSGLR